MTPEKQRIAIAEACGWDYHNRHPIHGKQSIKSWYYRDSDITVSDKSSLPDYLNDLNAMHQAEKVLTPHDNDRMTGWLLMLLGEENQAAIRSFTAVRQATAAQRAEAFLRTIGKWEDDK
jgi:hypothetical protein